MVLKLLRDGIQPSLCADKGSTFVPGWPIFLVGPFFRSLSDSFFSDPGWTICPIGLARLLPVCDEEAYGGTGCYASPEQFMTPDSKVSLGRKSLTELSLRFMFHNVMFLEDFGFDFYYQLFGKL